MSAELKKAISDFQPSEDGRWFHDGQDDFCEIAESMLSRGFTEKEVEELLSKAYRAVANEYGD